MKSGKFSVVLSLLVSSWAYAGSGSSVGNGGNAVVCKDSQGKVASAEAFDLYEGRAVEHLSYTESSLPAIEQARAWAAEIDTAFGVAVNTPDGFSWDLNRIYASFNFLPSGVGLKPIPDGAEFIIPKNCDLVQTANYQDFHHIYVDSDVWGAMSETQRAALILHETVYEHYRSDTEQNSVRARRTVAYIVSGAKIPASFEPENMQGNQIAYCRTYDAWDAGRPSTEFVIYQNTGKQLVALFYDWADHRVIVRSSIASLGAVQSWPFADDREFSMSDYLNSAVDYDVYAGIDFNGPLQGKIRVRGLDGIQSNETFKCDLREKKEMPQ